MEFGKGPLTCPLGVATPPSLGFSFTTHRSDGNCAELCVLGVRHSAAPQVLTVQHARLVGEVFGIPWGVVSAVDLIVVKEPRPIHGSFSLHFCMPLIASFSEHLWIWQKWCHLPRGDFWWFYRGLSLFHLKLWLWSSVSCLFRFERTHFAVFRTYSWQGLMDCVGCWGLNAGQMHASSPINYLSHLIMCLI